MTTPPGTVEIPPLTAEEISKIADDFEAFAGTLRANTAGRAAIARLVVNARLGLEAAQWKAAADLAQAGEYARAQQLTLCERERDELKAALANAAPRVAGHIDIVFDGPPGHIAGRFVEVEDETGKSIGIGDWIKPSELTGGFWRLRIPRHRLNQAEATKWLDVTAELRDRVAKLEATSKLAERVTERSAKLWPAPDAGKASPVDDVWVRVRGIRYPMQETLRPATEGMDGSFISIAVGHWRTCWAPYFDDDGSRYPMSSVPLSLEGCLKLVAGKRDALAGELAEERSEHRFSLNQASNERQTREVNREALCRALGIASGSPHANDWEQLIAQVDRLHRAHRLREQAEPGHRAIREELEAVEALVVVGKNQRASDAVRALMTELADVQRALDVAGADVAGVSKVASERVTALISRRDSYRSGNHAARDRLAQALGTPAGIEPTLELVVRMAVELLGSQKAASKREDLARRIRESSFIQGLATERYDSWLAEQTDGDLLDEIFVRANHCEVLEDQVSKVLSVAVNVKLGGAVMLDDSAGTPAQMVTSAIERARLAGKHEADAERATLVAKLQLVREALGATLQPDGTDDVVDKARDREPLGVVMDRELEWCGVVDAIATRLGIPLPASLEAIREALLAAIAKLQSDRAKAVSELVTTKPYGPPLFGGPDRFAEAVAAEMAHGGKLAPLPGVATGGYKSASSEQILRDVIAAVMASGLSCPADVFEVKHAAATTERPPRCELRVYAEHQSTVDHPGQLLAYVELGELWVLTLPDECGGAWRIRDYETVQYLRDHLRWYGAEEQRPDGSQISLSPPQYRWQDRIRLAISRNQT